MRLYRWRDPAVLAVGGLAVAAGFAQFGVAATLADVAEAFGEPAGGGSIAAQVGLSGTVIGIGLGIIRLASLGALPLAGWADRVGRRRMLLGCSAAGLAITVAAAGSLGFWMFVALFACARPLLTASNALALLVAGEETRTSDRAKAIALVAAGYGLGSGCVALVRAPIGDTVGFRGVFLLAALPLLLLPLLGRVLRESDRFERLRLASASGAAKLGAPVLGPLRRGLRGRLALLGSLTFSVAFVTGPANTFAFLYTEGVLGMSRTATAAMVAAAAPCGLLGLLSGRALADRVGRRLTAGGAQVLIASACALTYSGSQGRAVVGWLLAMTAGGAFAPAAGALPTELFPTSVRGSVTGWLNALGVVGAVAGLVVFGALADDLGGFAGAALVVSVPVALASVLFAGLRETRGLELEESAPERT